MARSKRCHTLGSVGAPVNEGSTTERLRKRAERREVSIRLRVQTPRSRVIQKAAMMVDFRWCLSPLDADFTVEFMVSTRLLAGLSSDSAARLRMLKRLNFDTFDVTIPFSLPSIVSCFQLADNGGGM